MKFFGMLGLVVTMLSFMACSESKSSTDSLSEVEGDKVEVNRVPFKASINISKKSSKALAKAALSKDEKIVETSWEVGEQVALVYEWSDGKYSDMDTLLFTITKVEAGIATIEGVISEDRHEKMNLDNVTLVYPATAADRYTSDHVKSYLLKSQQGLLEDIGGISELYDVRKGSGSIIKKDGCYTLDGIVDMVNQNAIFKFSLKDEAGEKDVEVDSLTIIIGETEYVVVPPIESKNKSEFYVALPAVDNEFVVFVGKLKDVDHNIHQYAFSKKVSFSAGMYYPSTLKMKNYGDDVALIRILAKGPENEDGASLLNSASSMAVTISDPNIKEGYTKYDLIPAGAKNEFFLAIPKGAEYRNLLFTAENSDKKILYYAYVNEVYYSENFFYQMVLKLKDAKETALMRIKAKDIESASSMAVIVYDSDGDGGEEYDVKIDGGSNDFFLEIPPVKGQNVLFVLRTSVDYEYVASKEKATYEAGKLHEINLDMKFSERVLLNISVQNKNGSVSEKVKALTVQIGKET